jgi:hypothetical protein
VRADFSIASTTLSTKLAGTAISTFAFLEQAHRIFGTTINLCMPLLMPVSPNFGYSHTGDADLFQCILHCFELERLDDCDDEFHKWLPNSRKKRSLSLTSDISTSNLYAKMIHACKNDSQRSN